MWIWAAGGKKFKIKFGLRNFFTCILRSIIINIFSHAFSTKIAMRNIYDRFFHSHIWQPQKRESFKKRLPKGSNLNDFSASRIQIIRTILYPTPKSCCFLKNKTQRTMKIQFQKNYPNYHWFMNWNEKSN